MKTGLLIIFTGNGKGKTTAALGMALRAAGHNMKVCFIQFIKGAWKSGETGALERFQDLIDFHILGRGFTWKSEDLEKDRKKAMDAWHFAKEVIVSGKYDMIVLDELTYLCKYNFLNIENCIKTLVERPKELHIVITGRDAPSELIKAADLVTEMRLVKHPYDKGVKAQKGIEY